MSLVRSARGDVAASQRPSARERAALGEASRGRRSGSEGWPASRGAPLAARPLVKPSVASVKTGPMLTWTSVVRPTQPPQRRAGRAAGLSIVLSCWFNLRLCRSSFTLQFGIFVTVRHLPVKLLAVMTIIRRLRSASELGRRVRVRIVLRDSAAQTRLRARQPRLPSLPGPAGRGKALACAEHPARRLVQRVGAYPPQPRRPPPVLIVTGNSKPNTQPAPDPSR